MNMEGNQKKVSVVVPNYNYADYLKKRLDSIINQTYPIYELIILDDCSTDDSVKVIKSYLKEHPDVNAKFIQNKHNSGSPFKQWSKGFETARGDYVWIAEADDYASPLFLETLMKNFDDPEVVLSYSESNRIDENDKITATSCRDWMLAASTTHWNNDYIISGEEEIKTGLSIMNTIPNVSAVVFKQNPEIPALLQKATEYTISGDWLFYTKLLKTGKIAYCSTSLNYFRKHTGSLSADVKKAVEVEEVLKIQKIIRDDWLLDSYEIHRQSYRYENILNTLDEKTAKNLKTKTAKSIAWIIPAPIKGSGGIRTIIDNANYLVTKGYKVDIYIEEDFENTSESMRKLIIKYYDKCLCRVFLGIVMRQPYDLVFATFSLQADYILRIDAPRKAYFIQDFEPWFEPMGDTYLRMANTYRYGLEGVSIGRWLSQKISHEFDMHMQSFNFCADTSTYKPLKKVKKENAICFIFQPEKPRRCSQIGISALKIVQKMRPDTKIYLYGSDIIIPNYTEGMENLKIISPKECNKLYNKCKVGLCLSSSNPSRIPFEMMAAGLPVVDLYLENNLYDVPDTGVTLAEPTPEAIATAIIELLDNKKVRQQKSKSGINFMSKRDLADGFKQFGEIVDGIINDKPLNTTDDYQKIYRKSPVKASEEAFQTALCTTIPTPIPISPTKNIVKRIVKAKRTIKNKRNNLIRKIFKI